jgi:hypothetical protein
MVLTDKAEGRGTGAVNSAQKQQQVLSSLLGVARWTALVLVTLLLSLAGYVALRFVIFPEIPPGRYEPERPRVEP